jgi:PAS domain S-box-containing protein
MATHLHSAPQPDSIWPFGTSEMHARVRAHNWAATPLGPTSDWPQSLKFAVNSTLAAGFPTLLLWGRDLIQFYNDAYLRLMDWREVPLGDSYRTSWPEDVAATAAIFERAWRGETVVLDETLYSNARRDDGRPICLTTNVSPLHDEMGDVRGLCLSLFDSTDRVLAQATLRESEAQLTQLLELLPVGVTLFDTDRNVIWRNPEMQRLLGLPHSHSAYVPPPAFDGEGRQLELDERPVVRALRGESVRPGQDLLFEVAGERRWLRAGAVPFTRDGKIAGCIAFIHDITEVKKNAEHMEVLVAELQHRTRNLIAVVRSLAGKTLAGSASLEDFRKKFLTRLTALARVQGLLSRPNDGGRVGCAPNWRRAARSTRPGRR